MVTIFHFHVLIVCFYNWMPHIKITKINLYMASYFHMLTFC
jgi:hypothetical protein